jgi:hypothetical protein
VLDGICARGAVCAVDIQYCSFVTHVFNVRIEPPTGKPSCWCIHLGRKTLLCTVTSYIISEILHEKG